MSHDIIGDMSSEAVDIYTQLMFKVTLMLPDTSTKVPQHRATPPDVASDTCPRTLVP